MDLPLKDNGVVVDETTTFPFPEVQGGRESSRVGQKTLRRTVDVIEQENMESTSSQIAREFERNLLENQEYAFPNIPLQEDGWKEYELRDEGKPFNETLETDLFKQSYFVFNKIEETEMGTGGRTTRRINTKLVELDEERLTKSTEIRKDPAGYVKKRGDLKDVVRQKTLKPKRKKKKETAGPDWFDLPKPQITPEIELDLKAIQLKRNVDDREVDEDEKYSRDSLPKFFQFGTIVEPAHQFYSDRRKRKDRKPTIVDQMIHDKKEFVDKKFKKKLKKIKKRKARFVTRSDRPRKKRKTFR